MTSNLAAHARRELELSGQYAEDPAYSESIISAVDAFASYGHSGGSASVAIEQLHVLLRWGHLSPLTDNPHEWIDHGDVWQSTRNPAAFSEDGGKTYYLVDESSRTIRPTKPASAHS